MSQTTVRGRPLSEEGEIDRAAEELLEAHGGLRAAVAALAVTARAVVRADRHLRKIRAAAVARRQVRRATL